MNLDDFNPFEDAEKDLHSYGSTIDFRADLNEDQYAAVTAKDGPALVLAGAGSGKTRTLTYRVAYLLEKGIKAHQILLLTFTNKAAKEMLERVEDLTGVGKSKFWGGTFHSIGQRILRMYGESVGLKKNFTILDQSDSESLLTNIIRSKDPAFLKIKENPKPKMVAGIISYSRNTCAPLEETIKSRFYSEDRLAEQILYFAKLYKEEKLAQQVVDYDDLLELWLESMEKDESLADYLQKRFKHILVDEYQDTNTLQSRIVDKIAKHHQLMAVGDDAQCIYTWRGANYQNIATFTDRHPSAEIFKIEINYRSSPEILNFANRILDHHITENPYHKELQSNRPNNEKPYFVTAMDTRQQAQFIHSRIRDLLREGRSLSDIAILYRAHYQAMDLQMELSKNGVPFQLTSGLKFFEQAHIKDLTSQLRFACNPEDQISFQRFTCLLPKVGIKTAERIYREALKIANTQKIPLIDCLAEPKVEKKIPEFSRSEWPSIVQTLKDISRLANQDAPPREIVNAAVEGWYSDYIRTIYENWESRLDDMESVVGFADRFSDIQELLAQLVLLNSETSDRNVELTDDKIKLSTIHQAKGLEFPIVFVIGLSDGMFPLKRTLESGDIDEERRLFYVSVTRAMDELYLVYPTLSVQGGYVNRMAPSRFIGDIPPSCYQSGRLPKPERPSSRW